MGKRVGEKERSIVVQGILLEDDLSYSINVR